MNDKELLIKEINDVKSRISNIWNSIYTKDIDTIKENWKDQTCELYIEKLKKIDFSINKIIKNLDKLITLNNSTKV